MAVIDYYSISDNQILQELGNRLRARRLHQNITQTALAERTLVSVGTVKALEQGKGKISNLVAVLRELDALQQLDQFIPPITIRPLQMADDKNKVSTGRVRATKQENS